MKTNTAVPTAMMGAVVAIGLFAIFRLGQTKSTSPQTTAPPIPPK